MADDTKPLDIAKFNLDAYKTSVEMNIKLMQAYADFNYRMMQVAELQIKVATDALKLTILRDAFESYRFARLQAMRRAHALEEKVEKHSTAIRRLNHLAMGEMVPPEFVGFGWQGFWYLQSQAPVATVLSLSAVSCAAGDRKGKWFYSPAKPEAKISDAPSTIKKSLLLMDWARKQSLVPRLGSPAQARLGELLQVLGDGAKAELDALKAEMKDAQSELKRVQEASWNKLDLEKEKPKNT